MKAKCETVIMMSYNVLVGKKIKPRNSEFDTLWKGSNGCSSASLASLYVQWLQRVPEWLCELATNDVMD